MPVISLRDTVAFPGALLNFELTEEGDIRAAKAAAATNGFLLLVTERPAHLLDRLVEMLSEDEESEDTSSRPEPPLAAQLYSVGTIVRIKQMVQTPDKQYRVIFEGCARATVITLHEGGEFATADILTKTKEACANNDIELAAKVEPLEQAIDDLIDRIKLHHVVRLQQGECTIELGFVLNDLLTCYERVSDHCSNVAGCIIEISKFGALDMHKYLAGIKHDSENFYQKYNEYTHKYHIED